MKCSCFWNNRPVSQRVTQPLAYRSWHYPWARAVWQVHVVPAPSSLQTCRLPPGSTGLRTGRRSRRVPPPPGPPGDGESLRGGGRLPSRRLRVRPLLVRLVGLLHRHCLREVPQSPVGIPSRHGGERVLDPRRLWQRRKPRQRLRQAAQPRVRVPGRCCADAPPSASSPPSQPA